MTHSRLLRDERGVALITALGVALLMSLLTLVTVSLSFHNVHQSAINRERVQSIAAAEAGLNRMFHHLETLDPDNQVCAPDNTFTISEVLTTSPSSSFEVTLYDEQLAPLVCPVVGTFPSRVVARSTGHGLGDHPERQMEALIDIIPVHSSVFGPDAIFADDDLDIDSNTRVEGDEGRNANIYSNATVRIRSNMVVTGSVFAQNEIHLDSNSEVKKDVWAQNQVRLNSNTAVRRNTTSSVSSVTVLTGAVVQGDARAGTTISGPGTVDGIKVQNSPQGPPPEKPFPDFEYNESEWLHLWDESTGLPTTISNFSGSAACADTSGGAAFHIRTLPAGSNHIVRIEATCELKWSSPNQTINLPGNVAIIHDGSITLTNTQRFTASGSTTVDLFLIAGHGSTAPCPYDVQFRSNSSIGGNIFTLMHTPCDIELRSNSFVIEGQLIAREVQLNSNTRMSYKPLLAPQNRVSGYTVAPTYIREIVPGP